MGMYRQNRLEAATTLPYQTRGDGSGTKPDMNDVMKFLSSSSEQVLSQYVTKKKLYYCKCLEGQAMYLPPGFLFHEVISADVDYAGARAVFFLKVVSVEDGEEQDEELETDYLHTTVRNLRMNGVGEKEIEQLQGVLNALAAC